MAPSLLPVTVDEGAVEINGFQVSHPSDNAIVGTTSGKQASLVISNGGTLENLRGIVGDVAGSEGEVLVTGPNSAWNNIERLIVGNDGVGTLSIEKAQRLQAVLSQLLAGVQDPLAMLQSLAPDHIGLSTMQWISVPAAKEP
ncbi:hypothetical protein HGG75_19030 [Ochrobactrum pseudogrignonense]|nr:hypothetical protein [Brucella pseudogrignonensis]